MDIPYNEVDRIAKMVPTTLNITLDQALNDSPALQAAYDKEPQVKELLDTARKLEGLVRNAGVHAAGVVIASEPLINLVPLHRTKNEEIVTAFDMKAIEKMGLLKMDFLGLTTLTVLTDALRLIEQRQGSRLDLTGISLDDAETYQRVFHRGLTSGVFQFSGMDGLICMLRLLMYWAMQATKPSRNPSGNSIHCPVTVMPSLATRIVLPFGKTASMVSAKL